MHQLFYNFFSIIWKKASHLLGVALGLSKKEQAAQTGDCLRTYVHFQGLKQMVIWAHHGTSSIRSAKIVEDGFQPSAQKDVIDTFQWLGPGAYFFENDPKAAHGWARYRAQNDGGGCMPMILVAVLACDKARFFDLNQTEQVELYTRFYDRVKLDAKRFVASGDKVDGLVLEVLCKELNVAMIRACLNTIDRLPLTPIGEWSRIIKGNQVQVCVRDLESIKAVSNYEAIGSEIVC